MWVGISISIRRSIFGDSAFSTSAVMIPAFKKGHNINQSKEKYFNTKLAKVWIKNLTKFKSNYNY